MADRAEERGDGRASRRDDERARARERFYEGILGSLEPFIVVDRQWRLTFVNRSAAEFVGRSAEELLGTDVREFPAPGADEGAAAALEKAMTERVPVEVDIADPTEQRHLLAAAQPIDDDGLAVHLRDVTAQVHGHEALLESEARFRTLADHSPFLIWVCGPDGDIEFVNRPYRAFFGVTEAEVRGRGWQPLVHPGDADRYVGEFLAALRERRTFSCEARVRDAKGEWRWVDSRGVPRFSASGQFLGMVGSSPDVTDRRRAEEALRESEALLRTVLDNSRDGINMLDLRTGRYVFMNDAQVALTGFTADEVNGISAEEAYERVHPEDRHVSMEQQRRVAAGEDLDEPVEYRWRVKSGEYRWFSDRRKIVRDEDGTPVALVGISRDITRRKRAEAARERQHLVLGGIATILQAALTAPDEGRLGETCLGVVELLTESAFGFIGLVGPDGLLHDVALSHPVREAGEAPAQLAESASADTETCGLLRQVVRTGEPLLTNSPGDHPGAAALPDGHLPLRAFLGVPLGDGENVTGVVAVAGREGGYGSDHLRVLQGVSPVIREAFDRRRAEEGLRENELRTVAQRERDRLARDLHDSVTQALFAATMKAEALTLVPGLPAGTEATAEEVRRLTRGALAQMRTLLLELRGDPLERVPLRRLLRHLVEATESRTSTDVRLTIRGLTTLPPELHTPIYRIVQEALNNVVRHAGASGAWVVLQLDGTAVRLEVSDDGAGFDSDLVDAGHLGLRSMRERAAESGGAYRLITAPGKGTRVSVVWRVEAPKAP